MKEKDKIVELTIHVGTAIQSVADYVERTANKKNATDKELDTMIQAADVLARLMDAWSRGNVY